MGHKVYKLNTILFSVALLLIRCFVLSAQERKVATFSSRSGKSLAILISLQNMLVKRELNIPYKQYISSIDCRVTHTCTFLLYSYRPGS